MAINHVTVAGGRRSGRTTAALEQQISIALHVPTIHTLWISPHHGHLAYVEEKAHTRLFPMLEYGKTKFSKGSISLSNGSRMFFMSPSHATHGVRNLYNVVIDDADSVDIDILWPALVPCLHKDATVWRIFLR